MYIMVPELLHLNGRRTAVLWHTCIFNSSETLKQLADMQPVINLRLLPDLMGVAVEVEAQAHSHFQRPGTRTCSS